MLFFLYCCVGLSKLLDERNLLHGDTLSPGGDADLMHDGRDSNVSRGDDDTSSEIRRARQPTRSVPKEGEVVETEEGEGIIIEILHSGLQV